MQFLRQLTSRSHQISLLSSLHRLCTLSKPFPLQQTRSHLKERNVEVPVSAYFIGHKIDLAGISGDTAFRTYRLGSSRDCVLFSFPAHSHIPGSLQMAVFRYGSIVFFNKCHKNDQEMDCIEICRKYTIQPLSKPNEDEQSLLIRPKMTQWYRVEENHVIVRVLDLDNIKVISSVLGQSVALDNYTKQADQALREFDEINQEILARGKFSVDRKTLFKLIARNNMMVTEAIVMLGLLDKSDIAWKNEKYYGVWSTMNSEYEMSARFEAMDKKIKLIQESAKHFLQILQDNKSNFLEILIIGLIAVEIVVSVYDLMTR